MNGLILFMVSLPFLVCVQGKIVLDADDVEGLRIPEAILVKNVWMESQEGSSAKISRLETGSSAPLFDVSGSNDVQILPPVRVKTRQPSSSSQFLARIKAQFDEQPCYQCGNPCSRFCCYAGQYCCLNAGYCYCCV